MSQGIRARGLVRHSVGLLIRTSGVQIPPGPLLFFVYFTLPG